MAFHINRHTLFGYVGKDADQKVTKNGLHYCVFTIATQDRKKDKPPVTTWHYCVAWGQLAELYGDKLKKGEICFVEGIVKENRYTNKSGNQVSQRQLHATTMAVGEKPINMKAKGFASQAMEAEEEYPFEEEDEQGEEMP